MKILLRSKTKSKTFLEPEWTKESKKKNTVRVGSASRMHKIEAEACLPREDVVKIFIEDNARWIFSCEPILLNLEWTSHVAFLSFFIYSVSKVNTSRDFDVPINLHLGIPNERIIFRNFWRNVNSIDIYLLKKKNVEIIVQLTTFNDLSNL